jgi:hypothetical protein
MADVKHCTTDPINDLEGFFPIFYCRIKNFTESLTEKLLRQVGWQGRVQNNGNSPHDVRSPVCQGLTQTYSPNFFLFSLLASGGFFHCVYINILWLWWLTACSATQTYHHDSVIPQVLALLFWMLCSYVFMR